MKKFMLIAVVAVFTGVNLVGALTGDVLANNGRMGCRDVVGCQSPLSCPGPGTPSMCSITCENGGVIICHAE